MTVKRMKDAVTIRLSHTEARQFNSSGAAVRVAQAAVRELISQTPTPDAPDTHEHQSRAISAKLVDAPSTRTRQVSIADLNVIYKALLMSSEDEASAVAEVLCMAADDTDTGMRIYDEVWPEPAPSFGGGDLSFVFDPDVCPSSLGQDDKPMDPDETGHKWDDTISPHTCAECGAVRTLKFAIHQYADISTGYLDPADLDRISNPDCPTRFAETDGGHGTFHYPASNDEDWQQAKAEARAFGLSERFIAIMDSAREQDIPYVRFDADGGDIEGMEVTPDA